MSKLAIALILVWLIGLGIAMAVQRRLNGTGKCRSRRVRSRSLKKTDVTQQSVRRSTRQALMALLNGDRKAAARLLENVRFRYPGKSETWYWEKVIYDLRRDRRV